MVQLSNSAISTLQHTIGSKFSASMSEAKRMFEEEGDYATIIEQLSAEQELISKKPETDWELYEVLSGAKMIIKTAIQEKKREVMV